MNAPRDESPVGWMPLGIIPHGTNALRTKPLGRKPLGRKPRLPHQTCHTPHYQITCYRMKKEVFWMGFWTWVVTWPHLVWNTVVVNVCRHCPRDLIVWCVTYLVVLGRCVPRQCVTVRKKTCSGSFLDVGGHVTTLGMDHSGGKCV